MMTKILDTIEWLAFATLMVYLIPAVIVCSYFWPEDPTDPEC